MQASEEKVKKKKLKKKKVVEKEEMLKVSEVPPITDEVPTPTPSSEPTADHEKVTYYCFCICSVRVTI